MLGLVLFLKSKNALLASKVNLYPVLLSEVILNYLLKFL